MLRAREGCWSRPVMPRRGAEVLCSGAERVPILPGV